MIFLNRQEAGVQLTKKLIAYQFVEPLIFALSQGGVPVAYEVAKAFKAPLDLVIVRQKVAFEKPLAKVEFVPMADMLLLNEDAKYYLRICQTQSNNTIKAIEEALRQFKSDRPLTDMRGRIIILIDDGLSIGSNTLALIQAIHKIGPQKLILAIPVVIEEMQAWLEPEVDAFIYIESVADSHQLNHAYREAEQPAIETIDTLLKQAHKAACP